MLWLWVAAGSGSWFFEDLYPLALETLFALTRPPDAQRGRICDVAPIWSDACVRDRQRHDSWRQPGLSNVLTGVAGRRWSWQSDLDWWQSQMRKAESGCEVSNQSTSVGVDGHADRGLGERVHLVSGEWP